jgi:hypothetical protein
MTRPVIRQAARALVLAAIAFAPIQAASSRPVVVELFTSQGCSSCPPADALLAELAGRGDILALGFHVDYWDGLGWKDPLSAPGATARQRDYARLFGRNGIYTPQMVIDGQRQVVGSNRDAVAAAIAASRLEDAAPVAIAADGGSAEIGTGPGHGTVLLIRFARDRATKVPRGENAGTIAHDVDGVEEIRRLGEWSGAPTRFAFDPPATGSGVAILVQAVDGAILGAGSRVNSTE